jgi:pilus assembly protein Flp/PilA
MLLGMPVATRQFPDPIARRSYADERYKIPHPNALTIPMPELKLSSGVMRPRRIQFRSIIMLKNLSSLLRDEEGATAIEYGLIVGLIAAVIIVVLTATGTNLTTLFTTVDSAIAATAG